MATIQRFEEVYSWKLGRVLAADVYALTRRDGFRQDEALVLQIRRSVISISSNIAEGFERGSTKDFINFLYIAKGSAGEVRSQLYIARDQQYLSQEEFDALLEKCEKTSQSISGFIDYLRKCARPKRQTQRPAEPAPDSIWNEQPPTY